jgi:3-hydroxyisobutyrate dehydrogenase-like beta-hydroxyacid dehydrogenase
MFGFIGLGQMGFPIALNLLESGHRPLHVYNRTAAKAAKLVEKGATLAASPAEVAVPGAIVFTMLSDDRAVEDVVLGSAGFVRRLGPCGVHVSMSTIAPATARRLAQLHQEHACAYLGAPVFGRPDAAAARKLWICLSGAEPAKARVEPILRRLGQAVFDFGEDPGAAHVAKLAGNFMIGAAMEAVAEAVVMLEKNGVDRVKVIEMLGDTLFSCPVYRNYGKAIAERRSAPVGFKLALGRKDLDLVVQTAAACQTPMPLANLVRDRLIAGMAKGRGEMDWSALALGAAEDAGLDPIPGGRGAS